MTTAQALPHGINLQDPRLFMNDQAHDAFRVLRAEAPVHWNPGTEQLNGFWSVTKYADILQVSRHPELFISSKGIAGSGLRAPDATGTQANQGNVSIITMDPPRHVKMRRLDAAPKRIPFGAGVRFEIGVRLDGLKPDDVVLEMILARHTSLESHKHRSNYRFEFDGTFSAEGEHRYVLELTPELCGKLEYRIRLYPHHELLTHPHEMGMMLWL